MTITLVFPCPARRWASMLLRGGGNLLLVVGLLCTGWYLVVLSEARVYQAYQKAHHPWDSSAPISRRRLLPPVLNEGDFVGRLGIPRIGIDAVVLQGTEARTLRLGIGHLTGSAFPAAAGNVVLAAHRDTFFRPLRQIKRGDRIRFSSIRGSGVYRVEWARIVRPGDTQVLRSDGRRMLTLITCYPFYSVGSAPERFIVRARLLAGSARELTGAKDTGDKPKSSAAES